jgi:hypothetical protein
VTPLIFSGEEITQCDADDRLLNVARVVMEPIRPDITASRAIIAFTSSGDQYGAIIPAAPSYFKLPNSGTYQEVYKARLDGCAVKDDGGSMVIDAESRKIYGTIIAGSESNGVVFIVAAHHVIKWMNEFLNVQVSLPFAH